MIYLLNADRGAFDSVAPLVEAGRVTHLPCQNYPSFERHIEMLQDLVGYTTDGEVVPHDDLVILDTITRMADTTRGDMQIGLEQKGMWSRHKIYMGDKNGLTVYNAAGQMIMRSLRNLSNRGFRMCVIAHEDDQKDEVSNTDKRAGAMNQALWTSLQGTSTDIYRLRRVAQDEAGEDGQVVHREGTRILQLVEDDIAICKYSVAPSLDGTFRDIPKYILNPNARKIERVTGKQPSFLTIYGTPGSGKTTLAVSSAFDTKKKAAETA